jgi:hypothetical protein
MMVRISRRSPFAINGVRRFGLQTDVKVVMPDFRAVFLLVDGSYD